MESLDLIIVLVVLIIIAFVLFALLNGRTRAEGEKCDAQNCFPGGYCSNEGKCEKGVGPTILEPCDEGKCILGLFCVRDMCSASGTKPELAVPSFDNMIIKTKINDKEYFLGISNDANNESYWSEVDTGSRFSYSSSRLQLIYKSEPLSINSKGLLTRGPASTITLLSGDTMKMRDVFGNPLQFGTETINGIALFSGSQYEEITPDQTSVETDITLESGF